MRTKAEKQPNGNPEVKVTVHPRQSDRLPMTEEIDLDALRAAAAKMDELASDPDAAVETIKRKVAGNRLLGCAIHWSPCHVMNTDGLRTTRNLGRNRLWRRRGAMGGKREAVGKSTAAPLECARAEGVRLAEAEGRAAKRP